MISKTLFKMSDGKSAGNYGLTVEFYKLFWEDIKNILLDSLRYSINVGELSTSQRQAIIKLIEKRDKDNVTFKIGVQYLPLMLIQKSFLNV